MPMMVNDGSLGVKQPMQVMLAEGFFQDEAKT
jgi:hypothetical protein